MKRALIIFILLASVAVAQAAEDPMIAGLKQNFPEIGPFTWDTPNTLWICVPSSFTVNVKGCQEIAMRLAMHYRKVKGYRVWVVLYYGNNHVIAREWD